MSDSESDCEIDKAAEAALATLVPEKSRKIYEETYRKFDSWCAEKNVGNVEEKILLAYFSKLSSAYKPSTLWSTYSMLRTMTYLNKNVDISKFTNVIAFLKRKSSGYRPKKSRIFSKQEIERFMKTADDKDYLLAKVVLITGIFGACRREEMTFLRLEDIEDCTGFIKVRIPNTKTKISRLFTINEGSMDGVNFLEIFRKYAQLRPSHTEHQRFFLTYRNSKCCTLPVGINTIGGMPKKIAEFLGLPNAKEYTGHCFRRCSATLLADSGADLTAIKRHGGWRSTSVAENYIENSVENKNVISRKIFGKEETVLKKIRISEMQSENSDSEVASTSVSTCVAVKQKGNLETSNIQFSNLSNCVVNVYHK